MGDHADLSKVNHHMSRTLQIRPYESVQCSASVTITLPSMVRGDALSEAIVEAAMRVERHLSRWEQHARGGSPELYRPELYPHSEGMEKQLHMAEEGGGGPPAPSEGKGSQNAKEGHPSAIGQAIQQGEELAQTLTQAMTGMARLLRSRAVPIDRFKEWCELSRQYGRDKAKDPDEPKHIAETKDGAKALVGFWLSLPPKGAE